MNSTMSCAFAVIAAVTLIGIWSKEVRSSFTGIGKVFAILAFAGIVSMASPLQAQENLRTAVHKVAPVYPEIARQMGLTGTVIVNVTVDPSGKVIKAESASANKVFIAAAVTAVKQWKYAPGDVTDTFPVTISFEKMKD